MRTHYLLFFFIALLAAYSCQPEEQIRTFDPAAKLRFSADTVLFDTVFTAVPTITKRLKVYNDNSGAISISKISIEGGENSPFIIAVNGIENHEFQDVRLLRGDSMLILVEALIDPMDKNLPFIVEDSLLFETNGNFQSVILAAWGQDANYLQDSILACNTTWTSDRPYVIYNSILVDSLCSLTINPGARIFSHKGSSVFIKGNIRANGTPEERISFLNDRMDEKFQNAPGQWDGIFFLEGSTGNQISFTDIRNSEYGIWLGTPDNDTLPDLILESVRIENASRTGLIAFTSDLVAINCLFNNAAEFVVGNFAGGNYRYEHCTFANFSFTFFRQNPLFAVSDNLVLADGNIITGDVDLILANSIVWGDFTDEVLLNNEGGKVFQAEIGFNILKTTLEDLDVNNNQLNADPLFLNPFVYDFHLDSLSPAINRANIGVLQDFDGITRDSIPDIGAFEWQPGTPDNE